MKAQLSAEVLVPDLLAVMPLDHSLGVPIMDGAIQIKTSQFAHGSPNTSDGPRLLVVGDRDELHIHRSDFAPLQAVAHDIDLGKDVPIFTLPIARLTIEHSGYTDSSAIWRVPAAEGLSIASHDGLTQFLSTIALHAGQKKIKDGVSASS